MPYKNKAQKKEYNRLYQKRNKEYLKNKRKEWELKNKDKLKEYYKEYHKEWYQRNKVARQKQIKEYSQNHKADNVKRTQKYVRNHKEKVIKYGKIYNRTISGNFRSYKHCAKKRNLVFELLIEEFADIIRNPCIYCGETDKIGIDRIDNNLGYTLSNSKPCCKLCNYMKRTNSVDEFLEHIKKVYTYLNY